MVKLNLSLAPYIHVDSIQQSLSPPYYLTSELPSLAFSSSSRGKQGGRTSQPVSNPRVVRTDDWVTSANSTTHFGDFESRNQPRMHAVASCKVEGACAAASGYNCKCRAALIYFCRQNGWTWEPSYSAWTTVVNNMGKTLYVYAKASYINLLR